MQSSPHRLAVQDVAFRNHLQERHCLWLPVPVPLASEPIPTDVALWLFELRHSSASYEVPNLNVECVIDEEDVREVEVKLAGDGEDTEVKWNSDEEIVQVICDTGEEIARADFDANEKDSHVKYRSDGEEKQNVQVKYEDTQNVQVEKEDSQDVQQVKYEDDRQNVQVKYEDTQNVQVKKEDLQNIQVKYGDNRQNVQVKYEDSQKVQVKYDDTQTVQVKYEEDKQNIQVKYEEDKQSIQVKYEEDKQNIQVKYEEDEQNIQVKYEEDKQNLQVKNKEGKQSIQVKYEEDNQNIQVKYEEDTQNVQVKYEEKTQNVSVNVAGEDTHSIPLQCNDEFAHSYSFKNAQVRQEPKGKSASNECIREVLVIKEDSHSSNAEIELVENRDIDIDGAAYNHTDSHFSNKVGEHPSSNQSHKSADSILWEANPLYCRVGDEGKEKSGRGFRKLCHSPVQQLRNSLDVDAEERASLIIDIPVSDKTEPLYRSSVEIALKGNIRACDHIPDSYSPQSRKVTTSSKCYCLKVNNEFSSMGEEIYAETCNCLEDESVICKFADTCSESHLRDTHSAQNTFSIKEIKEKYSNNIHTDEPDNCKEEIEIIPVSRNNTAEEAEELITSLFQNELSVYSAENPSLTHSNEVVMSCDEKCQEVLHDLDCIIQSFDDVTSSVLTDGSVERDVEFIELCQEAENLAEESLEQCLAVLKTIKPKPRSSTMSSDLSDDVFIQSTPEEKCTVLQPSIIEPRRHRSLDINSIFDDGTKPPVPPARKKRSKKRYKTIHSIDSTASRKISEFAVPKSEILGSDDKQSTAKLEDCLDVKDENSLLEWENQCQELLLIKQVTECTKEKRNVKAMSRYEDANSCCQEHRTDQSDLSSCTQDVNISIRSDVSSPSHTLDESVKQISVDDCGHLLDIVLTQTRPISSAVFPPSEKMLHSVSHLCDDKLKSETRSLENLSVDSCDESGLSVLSESFRSRKGSTSSDIAAWKQELQLSGLYYLDDEWDVDCMLQPDEWFSSNDSEGRVYFFEENSNESSWTLPKLSITTCESPSHPPKQSPSEQKMGAKEPAADEQKFEGDVQLRSDQQELETENKTQYRMAKAHSMVLVDSRGKTSVKSSSIPRNWPQLWDGDMCVLKEGTLNRTKITENGKKLRKNWAPAHVVLTELFLLFFKDAKTFAAMKNSQGEGSSGAARPEFCVDLNGALLEHGEKASSRRNVFLVSTVLGLQVLIQCESATQEEEWYQAIHKAITDLPSAYDSCPRHKAAKLSPQLLSSSSPEETKKSYRIGRSRSVKSVKLTLKDGSQEDLTVSPDENQTKIRNRLKKFFHRRPTKESLVKKGIYKDEPVFGCHLPDVCKGETPRVPAFVQRCVAAIECKEENMKTDGLYRASGNLSQVQKIRLQVDQNNLATLEQEEDVHVLTGALKLFFRELKQPLIPYEHFNKALKASTNPNKKEKLQHFRDIVKALSHPNRDTLEFLLKHLLRVTEYQEFNRMHIPNLAIVFGPTLMWPEAESLNMALDLMQQNLVIECFLQDFSSIFR